MDYVKDMKTVQTLHLKGCVGITPEALRSFKQVRPDVSVVDPTYTGED